MNAVRRHRPGILLAVLGLVTLTAAGACGAADSSSDSSAGSAAEAPARDAGKAQQGAPAQAPPGGAGNQDSTASSPDQRVDQRSIIYTGSIRVRVDDVDKAAADAIRIATTVGGFVGGDRRSGDSGSEVADLQLRVPAARFTTVVDDLAKLGEPLRREVSTEDVTEQTVDLAARIATQRARVESGRKLLAQAKSLSELVALEGEVAKREADLASLEAKQRRLADLTALSTISVELRRVVPPPDTKEEETEAGFMVGLAAGWRAFVGTTVVVLTVVGALLPWLVAVGVPVVALLWWLRRRKPVMAVSQTAPMGQHAPMGQPAPMQPVGPRSPEATASPVSAGPSAPGAGPRP